MRGIHPFRENSSLKPLLFFNGRDSRRASRDSLRIIFPARRDFFLLLSRLSPQAKDLYFVSCPLCGQLLLFVPQKQIGRTSQGKTACFPLWRLAKQEAHANHPFRYSDQTQILFSKSMSPESIRKKSLVGLTGGKSGFPSVPLDLLRFGNKLRPFPQ